MSGSKSIAAKYAERAHNIDFSEKWGTYRVSEFQPARLCFFNNVSYKSKVLIRERQTREFLRRLAEIGIGELEHAEYPDTGMDEGYSYALILDAPPKNAERVMQIWRDVFVKFGWDDADGEERLALQ
jgi:hypothetical protein